MDFKKKQICVDDYGEAVFRCFWTGAIFWASRAILTGPIIPQARVQHIAAPGYEAARRESARRFADTEQNCNTCRHLVRVPHAKDIAGFLRGKCGSQNADMEAHPYKGRFDGEVMIFHPSDFMGMPCYEGRVH